MATYFCTSCGNAQPKVGKFCTSCGAAIDASAVKTAASGRASSTVRLVESVAGGISGDLGGGPASSAASVSGAAPRLRRAWRPSVPWNRWLLASGAVLLLALVGLAVTWQQGLLPGFARGAPEIDRVVAVTEGQDGATTMVLMSSDGHFKVTLVDVPGFSSSRQATSGPMTFFPIDVVRSDVRLPVFNHIYGSDLRGAAVLASQRRILYWYPTADGMDVYSADLDGGDQVKLLEGQIIRGLTVAQHGQRMLLVSEVQLDDQSRRTSQREATYSLALLDLRGQMTPIVENVLNVGGTLSPDGNHLAYWVADDDQRFTLWAAEDTGANAVEIARDLTSVNARYASDSSKLFINRTDEQETSFQVAEANGHNPVTLSRRGDYGDGDVANNRLVYTITNNNETNLFTSDLRGDDRVEIVRGAENLAWNMTLDRARLIYSVTRNGRTWVQISDLKHEQTEELKRSDGDSLYGLVLDDDRVLIRRSTYGNGSDSLSTMKLDGSDEHVLKRINTIYSIDQRGESILVAGQEDGRNVLYLVGSAETLVLDDEADSYSNAYLTPNGQIIYTAHFGSVPVIYTIDRDGQQRKMIVDNAQIVAAGF